MPIKQTTSQSSIDAYIRQQISRREQAIIREFLYAGESAVNIARDTTKPKTFKDQTGNLRSSIGYVVAVDGQIVGASAFGQVLEGSQGTGEGKTFAESLASRFNNGIVLILVAGMEYAYYVKKRGYDVIDQGQLEAESLVKRLVDKLNRR